MGADDYYPAGTWGGDPRAPWNQDPDEGYEESLEGDEPPVEELTNIQKLAIAQAFYKSVAELVKTGDPYNLRGAVDGEYRKLYESTGAKSFDMKLGGKKVGTFSVVTTKPTESTKRVDVNVLDDELFKVWAIENDLISIDRKRVLSHVELTGEVPYGCELVEIVEPGDSGGEFKSTRIAVDPGAVAEAAGGLLEGISAALLLEGGE